MVQHKNTSGGVHTEGVLTDLEDGANEAVSAMVSSQKVSRLIWRMRRMKQYKR